MHKGNNNNNNNSSSSWRPGMETSGVAGNRVLLRLRKVNATRQLKADHSLTLSQSKPPSPKYSGTHKGKQRWGLDKRGNKRSDLCYMYCRQHFTENYKKVYEMRRQCSPEFRMVMEQPYCALHTYFRKYQCKNTIRFNTETNDINTMNSNNRIATTLYSLGT